MKHKKLSARILSFVLSTAMIGAMFSTMVFADEGNVPLGLSNVTPPAQEQCSCDVFCTEDIMNLDCAVCAAEGADLTACEGEAPVEKLAAGVEERTTPLDLTSTSLSYVDENGDIKTANPTTGSILSTGEGWSWDKVTNTLTLSGAKITNTEEAEPITIESLVSYLSYGIKLPSGSTIELTENTENYVTGGDIDTSSDLNTGDILLESAGVCVKDTDDNDVLTIQGKGTLNATGGTLSTGDAVDTKRRSAYSYGITSSDSLEIKGGTVIATAGDVTANSKLPQATSSGILSWYNITIADAAYVTATGGDVASKGDPDNGFADSCGLKADEDITITGSTVEAQGGGVSLEAIDGAVEGFPQSAGIYSSSDITISGGDVEANALYTGIDTMEGSVTINNGSDVTAVGCYYGIGADALLIDDSAVAARGFDETGVMGFGIVSNSSILITSGHVIAEGTILAMACVDENGTITIADGATIVGSEEIEGDTVAAKIGTADVEIMSMPMTLPCVVLTETQAGAKQADINFASTGNTAVSFDARNGENIEDVEIGEGMTLPTPAQWGDYTFAGWYSGIDGQDAAENPAFTGKLDETKAKELTVNTTVYAKWTKGEGDKLRTVRTTPLDLTASPPPTNPGDQGWTWDSGTSTLTLSGLELNNTKVDGSYNANGIIFPNVASTVILVDGTENIVDLSSFGYTGSSQCTPLNSDGGQLTIKTSGTGTPGKLNAIAGGGKQMSVGIYSTGGIVIESGDITATGGESDWSNGIAGDECNVWINGGSIHAKGDNAAVNALRGSLVVDDIDNVTVNGKPAKVRTEGSQTFIDENNDTIKDAVISFQKNYTGTEAVAPDASKATKTDTTITLAEQTVADETVEYGYSATADGEITWQDSTTFTGLSPNTEYFFFARVKETNAHTAGATSAGTAIKTAKPAYTGPAASAPSSTPTAKDEKSITLAPVTPPTGENVQYAKSATNTPPTDDSAWQDGTTFTGLSPNTEYFFFARVKENDTHVAGGVSSGTSITTDGGLPYTGTQAVAPNASKAIKTHNSITLEAQTIAGETVEYGYSATANGTITWQDSTAFTGLSPNTEYFFFARVKANNTHSAGATSAGTAIKTKTAPTTVSGKVKDSAGVGVSGATVELKQGNTLVQSTTTDASGNYTLTDVPAGVYNLVITRTVGTGNITITEIVTVAGAPISGKDIQFLSGDKNTVVESKPGAPDVVVGGMNDLLNTANIGATLTIPEKTAVDAGGSVVLKFAADVKDASDVTADKGKIEAIATGKKIDLLLDLSVLKTVKNGAGATITNGTKITTLADIIEVYLPIPADLQGKAGLALYRVHNGTAQALSTSPDENGEYYTIDNSGEFMTLYVKNFSTYALGYTAFTVTLSGGGNGATGAGNYANGDAVSINAGSKSGYTFDGWTVTPNTVVLTDPSSATTTFTMPSENVTVTASWKSSGGDGGSSSSDNSEYEFWMQGKEKIEKAQKGDVIKLNAKSYDKLPESVMDALRKNDNVSLVVTWNGGKTITIPAGKALKKEAGRVYWPLSLLETMYTGITEDSVLTQAPQNPETGGPSKLITLDAPAPAVENAIPGITENAQAITPPDAGFEVDAYVGTPDARTAHGINPIAVAASIMLLAAIGGYGVLIWKRREEK